MKNLSIKNKLQLFGVLIFLIMGIMAGVKSYILKETKANFDIYSKNAANGKILVVEIGKDLNYISRCTRDIMLGNTYNKNIKKIEKSIASIDKNFKKLEQTFENSFNAEKKKKLLKNAKTKMLAFIHDGYDKMKSLKNIERTPTVLAQMYQKYKQDATPLANASREAFKKIVTAKDKGVQIREKMFYEEINELMNFIWIEALVIFIVIILALTLLAKNIINSLDTFKKGLFSFFNYLNKKTNDTELIKMDSNDEFGQMSVIVNENISNIKTLIEEDNNLINDVSKVVEKVKNGYLNDRIKRDSHNEALHKLQNQINEMLDNLEANIGKDTNAILGVLSDYGRLDFREDIKEANGKIEIAINNLSKIINEMLAENKENGLTLDFSSDVLLKNVEKLNVNSTTTATSLEETALALEKITSAIVENTDSISSIAGHSEELVQAIQTGQELASNTVKSMDEINEQTQAIADAISIIDQIAFQTNILSLNAAVEAATAGEAGKGFAVVAQEVRNLASRSAEAAKEIKDIVETATSKTNAGKDGADKMIKSYESLNERINQTTQIINSIAKASKEQREGIERINVAITELDQQTQQNVIISNTAHTIATQTDEIAKTIVSSANEKEFRNKENIKRRESKQSKTNIVENSPISPKKELKREEMPKTFASSSHEKPVHKKIESTIVKTPVSKTFADNSSDDEWESF